MGRMLLVIGRVRVERWKVPEMQWGCSLGNRRGHMKDSNTPGGPGRFFDMLVAHSSCSIEWTHCVESMVTAGANAKITSDCCKDLHTRFEVQNRQCWLGLFRMQT